MAAARRGNVLSRVDAASRRGGRRPGFSNEQLSQEASMIEMPPLQFAEVNGIRMGFYEAGPKNDAPPLVFCHGWPELAFSWRHQIRTLSEAGLRVIAPDMRGYGSTDRPEPVEAYDLEHLTGDLVGLARPSEDRQGDLRRPRLGRLRRLAHAADASRARGRRHRGQHAPYASRAGRSDPDLPQAVRRQHVHRAVSGSGPRARPHLRGECRKDLRLLHARPLQEPPAGRARAGRRRDRRAARAQSRLPADRRRLRSRARSAQLPC